MRPRYRFPSNIDEVSLRFFGRFTWKDLLRIGTPTILTATTQNPVLVAIGILTGLAWFLVRPYGEPVDHYLYHLTRFHVRRYLK